MGIGAVGGSDLVGSLYTESAGTGTSHCVLLAGGGLVKGLALGSSGNILAVLLEDVGNDNFGHAAVGGHAGVHGGLGAGNRQVIRQGGVVDVPGKGGHRKGNAKGDCQEKGQKLFHGLSHTIYLLV